MRSSGGRRTGCERPNIRPSTALPVVLALLLICPALAIARSMDPFSIHAPQWLQVMGILLVVSIITAAIFHLVLWCVMLCDACHYGPFGWLLLVFFIPLGALFYYCVKFESSYKKKRTAVMLSIIGSATYILLAIGSAL